MKIKLKKFHIFTVGSILLTLSFIGCGNDGPTDVLVYAPVIVEISYQDKDSTYWQEVDNIVLRVSGLEFSPIVDTQSVDSTTFSLEVPTGEDRIFTAFAIDTNRTAYFWGRKDTSISNEDTTRLTIELTSLLATAGDSIIILRDSLPWGLSCTDSILDSLGINTIVVNSDSFSDLLLDPYKNTIIIPSDQPQEFYNNYKTYITKFNNFVFDGGVMFFSACHKGWNNGDINASNILFPSSVMLDTIYHTDTINIVTGNHPVLEGLDTLKGYYASYGWFKDYPSFGHILTVCPSPESDTTIKPTLLLYQYGSGLVLLSSQPLEYTYVHGTGVNNIGSLLPKLLSCLVDNRERLFLKK